MIPDLKNKVVLITGSSTGIGAEAAKAFGAGRRESRRSLQLKQASGQCRCRCNKGQTAAKRCHCWRFVQGRRVRKCC